MARLPAAVLLLTCLAVHGANAAESCDYTVKPGDYYDAIAETYGCTAKDLIQLNPGVNYNELKIGQVIKVPCLPTSCRFKTQEGDTLKSIAAIFNISVKKLKRLNPGVANPLPAGKALKVPCACKHEIQSGDSWDSVAKEYSTSAEGLRRLNPLLTELTPKKVMRVTCPKACKHTIVSGDTFYALAAIYGTDVETIKSLNRGVVPVSLMPGDVVKVPCD